MNICATSDLHGTLPEINTCDVLCICGDILPLDIQRNYQKSKEWFCTTFFEWVKSIDCQKVIFIGGNHDFFLQDAEYGEVVRLINVNHMDDKLTYLQDNSTFYNGLTFYGCPWVTGPYGWAFFDHNVENKYNLIEDCDILLTHQPPKIAKLGCSYPNMPYERDFGSDRLRTTIADKNIRYSFSGHIHSGDHNKVLYPTTNVDTVFYNVSLKDEDYKVAYQPLYIDVEPDTEKYPILKDNDKD